MTSTLLIALASWHDKPLADWKVIVDVTRRSHQFAPFVRQKTKVNECNGDFSPTTLCVLQ
jgi:hypothetical protein